MSETIETRPETACHAWLRGYSDGQLGAGRGGYAVFPPDCWLAYQRGYSQGMRSSPRGVVLREIVNRGVYAGYVHPDTGHGDGSDGFDR